MWRQHQGVSRESCFPTKRKGPGAGEHLRLRGLSEEVLPQRQASKILVITESEQEENETGEGYRILTRQPSPPFLTWES